jgi:cold shock protein
MSRFKVRTTVEWWSDAEGWGALAASEDTPGGIFVHFTAIRMEGFRTLRPGQEVEAVVHEGEQDGYPYQATVVQPLD